ncbi:DUF2029 domain-containing protein [bacterium]|nr:DUF2029 domain-containing protein [bacterium]
MMKWVLKINEYYVFGLIVFIALATSYFRNGHLIPPQDWPGQYWAGDLSLLRSYGEAFLKGGDTSPGGSNPYPPLATALGAELARLPLPSAIKVLYGLSILSFFGFVAFWLKQAHSVPPQERRWLSLFFVGSGVFSYPMLFEFERGQFNLLAMSLAFISVSLLEDGNSFLLRTFSIVLGCLAIHLKLYPILFVGTFFLIQIIRDFRERNISMGLYTTALFVTINLILLFVFGTGPLYGFFQGIRTHFSHPQFWIGNHSLNSYFFLTGLPVFLQSLFKTLFLLSVLVAFGFYFEKGLSLSLSAKSKEFLVLIFLTTEILPSVSHDYKLCYLPMVMMLFSSASAVLSGNPQQLQNKLMILMYPLMLLPYSNLVKPLQNKFVPLLVISIVPIAFAVLEIKKKFGIRCFTKLSASSRQFG